MTAQNKIQKGFTLIRTPLRRNVVNVQGFTLIELLIVIAVLGILAVAVLSAINPIEQIRRSEDTGSRSDAEQLISAIDRYYTTQGYYPWQTSATSTNSLTGWVAVGSLWDDEARVDVLTKLSSGGTAELKQSYINRITGGTYNTLFVYNRGQAGDSTYVCFNAKSGAFDTESTRRCGATLPADFPARACNNTTNCGALPNDDCTCLP